MPSTEKREARWERDQASSSSYTDWVIDRAATYGMPYTLSRVPSSTTPAPSLPILPEIMEEFQYELAEMTRKRNNLKRKYEVWFRWMDK